MRLHYKWPCPLCEFVGNSRKEFFKHKKETENGWQVLRIKWKDMFNYPKLYIRIAKNFIDLENED